MRAASGRRQGGELELIIEDDKPTKVGTVVAQKMVDAKIHAMIGHFNSGVTIPASKIYADAGIPQLSVSTNVMYRGEVQTTFRMMADDDKQGAALGRYATQTLKLKASLSSTTVPPMARPRRRIHQYDTRPRRRSSNADSPMTKRSIFATSSPRFVTPNPGDLLRRL
jgi:hypothetical protein